MRRLLLNPLLAPLLVIAVLALAGTPSAVADETPFVDSTTGLRVKLPDGWQRDTRATGGAVRFAAVYHPDRKNAPKKYVMIRVEAGPSEGFDSAQWLEHERTTSARAFSAVEQGFRIDRSHKVAGKSAPIYSIGGKHPKGYGLRIRACGVVNGPVFFRIMELSFNGGHEGQDEQLAKAWQAISFGEGKPPTAGAGANVGEGGGGDGGDVDPTKIGPATGSGSTVEDKKGNVKVWLPAGWSLTRSPPDNATGNFRLRAERGSGDIAFVEVYRFSRRAEAFSIGTPTDEVERLKGGNILSNEFGMENGKLLRPRTDESLLLGDADKSGQYIVEGLTAEEQEKVREADNLKRRGEKIEIPVFPKRVLMGRVALISPYAYMVRIYLAPGAAQNPQLRKEAKEILDKFEFYSLDPMPPHNQFAGEGANTLETQPTERKEKFTFVFENSPKYSLDFEVTVPAGIEIITDRAKLGPRASLIAYAQDDKNNWVQVVVRHQNNAFLGTKRMKWGDKKDVYAGWKSNWESKSRVKKRIPPKERSISLGIRGIRGKGYKDMVGKVEGHRGTFTGFLAQKSSWRHIIEIETRGDGDKVFAKKLKALFKKMKIKDK